MTQVREAAVAGQFYPGTAAELNAAVRAFLDAAETPVTSTAAVPKAIIAPHAGYVYSGAVAASAYARLGPSRATIKRVVLLGPCHRVPVRGLALSGADSFETPLGRVPVDKDAAAEILDMPMVEVFDAAHEMEHSLEVHLPFLQVALDDFSVVPLVVGEAAPEDVARVIEALWGGKETLIVVSSDLSHFLDYASAQKIDSATCKAIENLDPKAISRDGACGRYPVGGLLEAAKRRGMTVTTLDIRNSGDTAGGKDRVVGYGSWMFQEAPKRTAKVKWDKPGGKTGGEEEFGAATKALLQRNGRKLLGLAAGSIQHGLENGKPFPPAEAETLDPDLAKPGASFVTLKKTGKLRGCIGTSKAHRPLAHDVADNGFRAAFKDPRFPAVTAEEIEDLVLSLSVLSPQSPMAFSGEEEFLENLRPHMDGLVIEDLKRRALFLPSVWSQLPEPKTFVEHLKSKAGLPKDHWSDTFKAWRFVAEEISAADLDDPASIWAAAL